MSAGAEVGEDDQLVLEVVGYVVWDRRRKLKPELQGFFEGASAGVVAFIAAGFAGSSLLPAPEQLFLWLAIGVMFGVRFKFAAATQRRRNKAPYAKPAKAPPAAPVHMMKHGRH